MLSLNLRDVVPASTIFFFKQETAYEIVQGLSVDDFSRGKMTLTENELREERAAVEDLLK